MKTATVADPILFERIFSDPSGVEYDPAPHDIEIKDEDGKTLFVQRGVLAPRGWSERAVRIAASKYLYGDPAKGDDPASGGRESSVYALHYRVAEWITQKGIDQGVIEEGEQADIFGEELLALTLGQFGAFNSPVWFNVGLDKYGIRGGDKAYAYDPDACFYAGGVVETHDTVKYPQASACFIQSVEDNMESLMELARNEAMLFKHGSGTGTDFGTIRSRKETLSNGGIPSGPLSFMRVYDRIASVVKSGGKTRRAAKMQTMGVGHPDILDFIRAKGREEKKAHALIAAGYDANFNGEAYDTVAFQNANFSVRVTRSFLHHLDHERAWPLHAVTDGRVIDTIAPAEIWDAVAEETHRCGDPGLQFADEINDWHTCPIATDGSHQPINSSNPCSEYLFIDDSACNLASINLMKFRDERGRIDIPRLRAAARIFITAMEIIVDGASYPTRKIAQNSHDYRTLGLGFANLGGLLQAGGIAYDSDEGRRIAGALAAIIGGESYCQSGRLAAKLGPFPGYKQNAEAMQGVIRRHRFAAGELRALAEDERPPYGAMGLHMQLRELAAAGQMAWIEAYHWGRNFGYRNAQVTVVAPTGTIAFMMDCDTTGIEPNLALVATKTLAGGGTMLVANRLVGEALDSLGYRGSIREDIERYIADRGTAESCPYLDPEDIAVFDSSFPPPGFKRSLHWTAHLGMMAAVQPFVSGAISKTVNMPAEATVEDIKACYREAEILGLKCVAIYRDSSKMSQPLVAEGAKDRVENCGKCGSVNVVAAGTCGVCTDCGEPTGGCS